MDLFRLGWFFLPDCVFSDFDDVWLRCPLTLRIYCWYIVDNSVKEVYCFTWKSHFGCFRLFRGCFRPFRGCFRPKKLIKIRYQHKKTANITHRAFLFTWIVHQDLIRIPQNMDKITFRLSFQFPPQADIWGQAEIQALWKIQVYYMLYVCRVSIFDIIGV